MMLPALVVAATALAMVAQSAAAADRPKAQAVTVVTTEYGFSPAQLTFKRGIAYRLRVKNRGKELHEFSAPEFFKASNLGNPGVLNADKSEIAIPPGQVKELRFTPQQAGHYRLICPDHDWAGMTGEITVE